MANANRKAKGTTLADKKLKKAQERIGNLQEQVASVRMSTLNMRQLVERANQERDALQDRLDQSTQIITAAALQSKKSRLVITKKTLTEMEKFVGYELEDEDGNLVVIPISLERFEKETADE